ncbi:MAG: RnfABCDGE type electron transport complex subunit B [Ignavibacteria bacterium]|nr:RnfABCDGE type electron transport complex subunit B [Ignavibacteria bacterium]
MELTFWIALATMGGLGLIFAGALAIADKKLRVKENPLIGKVNELLPGANCGGCGSAGCYDFAVKLVEGKASVNGCPVNDTDSVKNIALLLGLDADDSVRLIPRILCRGGNNEAVQKMAEYFGPLSCSAMDIVSGGTKLCYYGCLGGGDCVKACPFDAMVMNDNNLPELIEELCTGCGLCAKACPRNIIEMHPKDRMIFVYCKNHDDPKTSKSICKAACLGCGACARKSEGGLAVINNLGVVNYDRINPDIIPFEKCSSGALTRLNVPDSRNPS